MKNHKDSCGGGCACGGSCGSKIDVLKFLTDITNIPNSRKSYVADYADIFHKHGVSVEVLLEISNKVENALALLFGETSLVFSCFEEKWSVNESGFIVVHDLVPEDKNLQFIVSRYTGCIGQQVLLQASVFAPGMNFHGTKGGLLLMSDNYTEDFVETDLVKKLFIAHDEHSMEWVINNGAIPKGIKLCSKCGAIASASTEKGWFCESCDAILSILNIK